MLPINVAP